MGHSEKAGPQVPWQSWKRGVLVSINVVIYDYIQSMNHIYLGTNVCTAGCQWKISPETSKAWISAASLLIFWTDPLDATGNHNAILANGLLGLQLVVPRTIWVHVYISFFSKYLLCFYLYLVIYRLLYVIDECINNGFNNDTLNKNNGKVLNIMN